LAARICSGVISGGRAASRSIFCLLHLPPSPHVNRPDLERVQVKIDESIVSFRMCKHCRHVDLAVIIIRCDMTPVIEWGGVHVRREVHLAAIQSYYLLA